MAEMSQQMHPLAPSNGVPRSDEVESATTHSEELRKKQRQKRIAYIAAFVVFQTAIILVFALVVMRVKAPKVRLMINTVMVDNIVTNSSTTSPSFSMRLTARVSVKNTNFGHYKFGDTFGTFMYEGVSVGQFIIPERRVRPRTTKKNNIMLSLSSGALSNNSRLSAEIDSGILTLTSHAMLRGKVQFMRVIKKKKSAQMNCTMGINLSTKAVQDLKCK